MTIYYLCTDHDDDGEITRVYLDTRDGQEASGLWSVDARGIAEIIANHWDTDDPGFLPDEFDDWEDYLFDGGPLLRRDDTLLDGPVPDGPDTGEQDSILENLLECIDTATLVNAVGWNAVREAFEDSIDEQWREEGN